MSRIMLTPVNGQVDTFDLSIVGGVSMSRIKLTPVNGQIDTFDLLVVGGVSTNRIKLTPVSGQVDIFDLTGTNEQTLTPFAGGSLVGCTETITLIHHIEGDDDIYQCYTAVRASWHQKTTIATSADGAKPVNTYDVRIFGDFFGVIPSLGDYVVKGIVLGIETPRDLKNEVYFRITSIGDNRRGGLPHWRVSGQ